MVWRVRERARTGGRQAAKERIRVKFDVLVVTLEHVRFDNVRLLAALQALGLNVISLGVERRLEERGKRTLQKRLRRW